MRFLKLLPILALTLCLSVAAYAARPKANSSVNLWVERLNGSPGAATESTSTGGNATTVSGITAGSTLLIQCFTADAAVLGGNSVTSVTGHYVPQNTYPAFTLTLTDAQTSFSFKPYTGTTTMTCKHQVLQ